ncbi:MAG: hypothetical protein U9R75_00125 [Candidatus Thermoplasmatota archaeon]|nr:hypothetical protein [Candidatus Thermoplasmatota archaeon]
MVFDSLKRFFGLHKYDQTQNHQMELIDEEIDGFEKDIQEYLSYSDSREPAPNQQPEILSKGAAIASSPIITQEEQRRITGDQEIS